MTARDSISFTPNAPSMLDGVIKNLRAARADIEQLLAMPMAIDYDYKAAADLAIEHAETCIRAIPENDVYRTHALVLLAAALSNLIGDMPACDAREDASDHCDNVLRVLQDADQWKPEYQK